MGYFCSLATFYWIDKVLQTKTKQLHELLKKQTIFFLLYKYKMSRNDYKIYLL